MYAGLRTFVSFYLAYISPTNLLSLRTQNQHKNYFTFSLLPLVHPSISSCHVHKTPLVLERRPGSFCPRHHPQILHLAAPMYERQHTLSVSFSMDWIGFFKQLFLEWKFQFEAFVYWENPVKSQFLLFSISQNCKILEIHQMSVEIYHFKWCLTNRQHCGVLTLSFS